VASHAHEEHDDHGLAHVASKKVLIGTGGTLLVLTIITVLATKVDFGGQMNLVVAMLIATIKASLVAMFFMHLRYDKPFHTVVIVSGLLFALLFVAFAFMDGNQYQSDVCAHRGADCQIWTDVLKERAGN
jgi:cytochrome c oxidase subunit 4